MSDDEINKWMARKWLGVAFAAFFTGVLLTLFVVLIVMLMRSAI